MRDLELSIEQKKRDIIEDRLNKIRDAGYTGEINLWIKYLGKGKILAGSYLCIDEKEDSEMSWKKISAWG